MKSIFRPCVVCLRSIPSIALYVLLLYGRIASGSSVNFMVTARDLARLCVLPRRSYTGFQLYVAQLALDKLNGMVKGQTNGYRARLCIFM